MKYDCECIKYGKSQIVKKTIEKNCSYLAVTDNSRLDLQSNECE